MRTLLVVLLLLTLAFAGCSDKGGEGKGGSSSSASNAATGTGSSSSSKSASHSGSSSGSGTQGPTAANHAPIVALASSATSGQAPLVVQFNLTGTDPDGDAMTWNLTFGDGTAAETGSKLPASVNHTFTASGNFTVKLVVRDGKASSEATLSVATVAGSVPPPVTFTGTATGLCGDPGFILTATEGDCFPDAPYQHPFTVPASVKKIVATLAWEFDAPAATDLDLHILDAGGEETGTGGGCTNIDPLPNPDVPQFGPFFGCVRGTSEEVVVEGIALDGTATWTAVVDPYQAYEIEYTLTITYS